ncbi:uncharacterized protein LOC129572872 [Sitodiplosis mosellana]|uniref:uncharacterized protein LOC129572872 n=1 Tax=Sitodiplosis mosellana TaxID=263140 RepID=UPI002444E978|nr:uncharacterized protein LOC129572872 [Sitodiplosis mosellana]
MRSLQTTLVVFDSSIMDPDTFKLIRKLCAEFQLPVDIEFTCYEAYMKYFKRFFPDLETQFKQTTLESNGATTTTTKIQQTSQLIDHVLDGVEKTSLLHVMALISICAKYVNGFRCEKLFSSLSKYLQLNGTPYSTREIRNTEYIVFKLLGFNIKSSELYSVAIDLATQITNRNHELAIRFDQLHDSCVQMLRFIYLYRKKFNEIFHYVEQSTYGYNGNEEFKLGAATVYASTMLINSTCGNSVLNEIVNRTYLNESLIRKLGQSGLRNVLMNKYATNIEENAILKSSLFFCSTYPSSWLPT